MYAHPQEPTLGTADMQEVYTVAYVLTHFWPNGTEEQYRATIGKVHPEGGKKLPPGQSYHAAGPTEGGFLVVAVWDSKEIADKFIQETLLPAAPAIQGGLQGPPQERSANSVNIQTG